MSFNEWLYQNTGYTAGDDMTDEDYDMYWEQYTEWKERQDER